VTTVELSIGRSTPPESSEGSGNAAATELNHDLANGEWSEDHQQREAARTDQPRQRATDGGQVLDAVERRKVREHTVERDVRRLEVNQSANLLDQHGERLDHLLASTCTDPVGRHPDHSFRSVGHDNTPASLGEKDGVVSSSSTEFEEPTTCRKTSKQFAPDRTSLRGNAQEVPKPTIEPFCYCVERIDRH
jgi:hypothetical protein